MEGASPDGEMEPATWLCLLFTSMAMASYVLWCLGRSTRLRLALAILSFVFLVIGVAVHGYLFGAPNPRPTPTPQTQ